MKDSRFRSHSWVFDYLCLNSSRKKKKTWNAVCYSREQIGTTSSIPINSKPCCHSTCFTKWLRRLQNSVTFQWNQTTREFKIVWWSFCWLLQWPLNYEGPICWYQKVVNLRNNGAYSIEFRRGSKMQPA